MFNFIWFDIVSSVKTDDSKWLDSSCDSTLTRLDQLMTWPEKILDDSDSKGCDSTRLLTRQIWLGNIIAIKIQQ